MDLNQLANLGEFFGGIAVLVTLIYLTIQVRQGNQLAATSAAHDFRRTNNEMARFLSSSDISQLYLKGLRDREALSSEDRIRFDTIVIQIFRALESQFIEHRDGHLSEEIYLSYERTFHRIAKQSGARSYWKDSHREFTPRFVDYINGTFSMDPSG